MSSPTTFLNSLFLRRAIDGIESRSSLPTKFSTRHANSAHQAFLRSLSFYLCGQSFCPANFPLSLICTYVSAFGFLRFQFRFYVKRFPFCLLQSQSRPIIPLRSSASRRKSLCRRRSPAFAVCDHSPSAWNVGTLLDDWSSQIPSPQLH